MVGTSYSNIFKTTFLFGFVQVFNIIVRIVQNKIVAYILGPLGMGTIGLYNNSLQLLTTGCGLGLPQSAVKDISEAKASDEKVRLSYTISLVRRIILYTGLLGMFVTLTLSYCLSQWSFGDGNHTLAFIFLSLSCLFSVISQGQTSILTGTRHLKSLAKSSMIGSLVGLCTAVPLYCIFGERGIVPALIIIAFSSMIVTRYFVEKVQYRRTKITLIKILRDGKPMIKMGFSLMLVNFMGLFFALLIGIMIRTYDSIVTVGIYNAGVTIITGYFGIVLTAMTTDYYPRICAINNDNQALQIEVNKQSEVGVILVFPLAIIFTLFAKFFINFLYNEKFYDAIYYTDFAILGSIIVVCSNCMGMVTLAKQRSDVFLLSVLIQRAIILVIWYFLFLKFRLLGLGLGYFLLGIISMITQSIIGFHFYNIKFSKKLIGMLVIILFVVYTATLIREMEYSIGKMILEGSLIIISCVVTSFYMKYKMGINSVNFAASCTTNVSPCL